MYESGSNITGYKPSLLDHLSLSNPASVHTSPINTKLQTAGSHPDMNINSLFSPPITRRTQPINMPSRSQPMVDHFGGQQQQSEFMGPSSLPSTSYMSTYASHHVPSAAGSAAMHGQIISSNNPQLTRRSHSSGFLRPSLVRQHRSFDNAEFLPSDPYNLQAGSTTDFPVVSLSHHPTVSSVGYGSGNYPSVRTMAGALPSSSMGQTGYNTSFTGALPSTSYGLSQSAYGSAYNPTNQPLHVSTAGSSHLTSGPLSGPGAAPSWSTAGSSVVPTHFSRDPYQLPVPVLQREYEMIKREYDMVIQKLNSTMNSIKTFWSPELKRERALRKEEMSKLSLFQEQLRMSGQENQKHTNVIRQLQGELQCQYDIHRTIRDTDIQTVSRDEYDALRLERDRMHREMQLAKDTLRELELQIETQRQTLVARDEAIRKLLDMLQSKGMVPYNAAQERMELENSKMRIIELEGRCKHLEQTAGQKDTDIRTLQDECMSASEKIRQLTSQIDWLQKMPPEHKEASAYSTMVDAKDSKIVELEKQLQFYEQELRRSRDEHLRAPRNFTDKMVSSDDYSEMKLKMERSELELSHKQSEFQAVQTRLITAEEQVSDFKKHLEVLREANSGRENQIALLQSDIETLRSKLETKNETIEQRSAQVNQTNQDVNKLNGELSDLQEQLKIKEGKLGMQQRKIAGMEELVKEKEQQVESLKQRMQNLPAVQQQRQVQDQLEEMIRERDRIGREMREQREVLESERLEQLEKHRREVRDLRLAIESLQKEITDRQVLIESQNENIADLNRELTSVRAAVKAGINLKSENVEDGLSSDLHLARTEVDKLLKMVQTLEKDKEQLTSRMKDVQRQLDDARRSKGFATSYLDSGHNITSKKLGDVQLQQKDTRIDELEEALRESVSITAERELAIAQQKQIAQQMEQKMTEYRTALEQLQRQFREMNTRISTDSQSRQDKDSLVRSLKHERRKHLEEVLQLKQEALVAAISEKDAHIALLELNQNKSPDELHTLRKHKEKLMRKLKEENEKRMRLLNEHKMDELDIAESPLTRDFKASPVDQLVQAIRCVELQKKKIRVFIDQLVACILELDPDLLTGLPRTQQSQGVETRMLKKLTRDQLLLQLQERENDSLQLQHYANELLLRLSQTQPGIVRRAMKLLDSLDTPGGTPQVTVTSIFGSRDDRVHKSRQIPDSRSVNAEMTT